jgi:hypothetical protein
MERAKLVAVAVAALCAIGCPVCPGDTEPDRTVVSFYTRQYNSGPVEAGGYGILWSFIVKGGYDEDIKRVKYILTGPGEFLRQERGADGVASLVPIDASKEYEFKPYSSLDVLYRPPSNDEVSAEGAKATLALEAFNSFTGKWARSPAYGVSVTRRDAPMDIYVLPSTWNEGVWKYEYYQKAYPDELFSCATVTAGEEYRNFPLFANPRPSEDIDLRYRLDAPAGYAGGLGELASNQGGDDTDIFSYGGRRFTYTAPDRVEEPVEITAVFSIYDPWGKERRQRELVFHIVPVVPK